MEMDIAKDEESFSRYRNVCNQREKFINLTWKARAVLNDAYAFGPEEMHSHKLRANFVLKAYPFFCKFYLPKKQIFWGITECAESSIAYAIKNPIRLAVLNAAQLVFAKTNSKISSMSLSCNEEFERAFSDAWDDPTYWPYSNT